MPRIYVDGQQDFPNVQSHFAALYTVGWDGPTGKQTRGTTGCRYMSAGSLGADDNLGRLAGHFTVQRGM